MSSATCVGERCHCGEAAVKKVGEEIAFDDPTPARHNLTAYVCARHYAQMMGPVGAQQVGYPLTRHPRAPLGSLAARAKAFAERMDAGEMAGHEIALRDFLLEMADE